MFIRAYEGSQGKGSYKHEALISSGSYLLNDEKGSQKGHYKHKALISDGSYKHTCTVLVRCRMLEAFLVNSC